LATLAGFHISEPAFFPALADTRKRRINDPENARRAVE
jgi:hypothetical protein